MMLTDLADVIRAAGLTVIEVPGWRTRGHGPMVDVLGVTCHHTAGSAHGNAPSLTVVRDGRADLSGPLAHLLLARDGTVCVVAAGLCWHAGVSLKSAYENAHRIGIEAENTGLASDPWPGVQITAYARLCAALGKHYGFPVAEVLGHKETCAPVGRKTDPSFAMPPFRARVAGYYTTKPTPAPPAAAPTDFLEEPMKPVVFTDAYEYDKAIKAGKTDKQARAIARVEYKSPEAAFAGLGSFLSSILRDVAALKASTK